MKNFKTIDKNANGQIEEKKSKFIADILYVETVEQVEEALKTIKKEYFDARHHCYAYRLIEDETIREKSSDDGEPSGTAGAPIMNILQKNELTNVLVIVTRYFGGTLLGTGGLVHAYSEATLKALGNTQIILQEIGEEVEIEISYKDLEKLKYYCHKRSIEIEKILYEKEIKCTLKVNAEEKEKIEKQQKEIEILKLAVLKQCYIRKNIEK